MPRYFLHVRNGSGFVEDEEGQDLPGLEAAAREAVAGARSLLSEEVKTGRMDLRGRIEVTDEGGALVEVVPFGAAVSIVDGDPPPPQ